jgi:hypothetical protein
MGDGWVTGVPVRTVFNTPGGTYGGSSDQGRFLLHTTQGSSLVGAVATYEANGRTSGPIAPHFTYDWLTRQAAQHIPVTKSAYSLQHPSGFAETNRVPWTIQIEIVGYAEDSGWWPDQAYERLGSFLNVIIGELWAFGVKVPLTAPPTWTAYPLPAGVGRPTRDDWCLFGMAGHQHVPGNTHLDPGAVDAARLLSHLSPPGFDGELDMNDEQMARLAQLIADAIWSKQIPVHNYDANSDQEAPASSVASWSLSELSQIRRKP